MLLSSHLLNEVELIADEMILIGRGRIVAQGDKRSLLAGAQGPPSPSWPAATRPSWRGTSARPGWRPRRSPTASTCTPRRSTSATSPPPGIVLTELRPVHGGLEDLFLELTSDTQRDALPAGAGAEEHPDDRGRAVRQPTGETRTLDVSGHPPIPFTRLLGVELRKMWDTRAGLWLLIAIGVITAAIIVIFFLVSDPSDRVFQNFIGITATPQGFLLPVLGILLITSEWGQRTTLTTFTLVPRGRGSSRRRWRPRWCSACVAVVIAIASRRWRRWPGGPDDGFSVLSADDFAKFGLLQVSGILQGLAFGLIFLNSAAAIVTYFVLPTVFSIIASIWAALSDVHLDRPGHGAAAAVRRQQNLTGEQWAQIATASLIWIVLPFLAGLVRVMRAEVK